jgi:ribonuclease R
VHLTTLTDDFYRLNEEGTALVGRRSGRMYAAGDGVEVTIEKVDRFKRQVDFRLAPKPGQETRGPDRRRARGG